MKWFLCRDVLDIVLQLRMNFFKQKNHETFQNDNWCDNLTDIFDYFNSANISMQGNNKDIFTWKDKLCAMNKKAFTI